MLAVVHRSHGNTRPGLPSRRRYVCLEPVGISITAALDEMLTIELPLTSHTSPIWSMRAQGLVSSRILGF